ncbi:hypothetical protein C8F01DRAFT_1244139 [Mycena amicta]|nr:hypothetical protein C8F01DRAFT_1244139 [Mycena amicta]
MTPPSYPTTARPALDILPLELWETIFEHDLPDTELLSCATLCRLFNELCIEIYLQRRGWTPNIFVQETLPPLSHETLSAVAVYAPSRLLAAKKLACHLEVVNGIDAQLARLQNVADRAPSLEELFVSFDMDLLWQSGPRMPHVGLVLRSLCAILSSVAQRVSGPVFVLSPDAMHTCLPGDMAEWRLERFRYNPAPFSRAHRRQEPEDNNELQTTIPSTVDTRFHNGTVSSVASLRRLHSTTIKLVRGASALSIVAFNVDSLRSLSLNYYNHGNLLPHLDCMIRHVFLPALRALYLHLHNIDPSALRQFLVAHPKLECVEHHAFREPTGTTRLIHPPLAHPGITELHESGHPAGWLVSALIDSPRLETIRVTMPAFSTPAQGTGFLNTLRLIGARSESSPASTLKLDLSLSERRRYWLWNAHLYKRFSPATSWVDTQEMPTIAAKLTSVRAVQLSVWSLYTARRLLPFLALFPALADLDLALYIRYSERYQYPPFSRKHRSIAEPAVEAEEFLREVRKALPAVGRIHCIGVWY